MALPSVIDPAAVPVALRIGVGAAGAAALLFGGRLALPAILGSAFVGGAILGGSVAGWIPGIGAPVQWLAGLGVGVVAAVVTAVAYRAALLVTGLVVGGLVGAGLGVAIGLTPWSALVGALVGALGMPLLQRAVIKGMSALVGALLVAWAAGVHQVPWIVAGLWAVGAGFQLLDWGRWRRRWGDGR